MTDPIPNDNNYFCVPHAEISIDEPLWHTHTDLSDRINEALSHALLDSDEQVSILLTDDTHIQQLNRDFRNKDKPTNVLSFPADEDNFIGDIAISYNTILREAEEQGKDFYHHFVHMLIHGVLHLLGYDHITESEAEEMEKLEIKILEDMGIENPYI